LGWSHRKGEARVGGGALDGLRRLDDELRPGRNDPPGGHRRGRPCGQRLAVIDRHLDAQGHHLRIVRIVLPGLQAPEHNQAEKHRESRQREDLQRRKPSPQ
jgi:hypothetical protein